MGRGRFSNSFDLSCAQSSMATPHDVLLFQALDPFANERVSEFRSLVGLPWIGSPQGSKLAKRLSVQRNLEKTEIATLGEGSGN